MIMASLLSWIVLEKLNEGLLAPPSCNILFFLFYFNFTSSVNLLQQKKKTQVSVIGKVPECVSKQKNMCA